MIVMWLPGCSGWLLNAPTQKNDTCHLTAMLSASAYIFVMGLVMYSGNLFLFLFYFFEVKNMTSL